jgi:hypothetical protein
MDDQGLGQRGGLEVAFNDTTGDIELGKEYRSVETGWTASTDEDWDIDLGS